MSKILKRFASLIMALSMCMLAACSDSAATGSGSSETKPSKKLYSSTATILVKSGADLSYDQTTGKVSGDDVKASLVFVDTVIEMLKSSSVCKSVAEQLGEEYAYQTIADNVLISRRSDESLLIDITVLSENSEEAEKIANAFANVSCERIPKILPRVRVVTVSAATKPQLQK